MLFFRPFTGGVVFLLVLFSSIVQASAPPSVAARSWILLEYGSGQVLGGQLSDERVEPASLAQLMTAYVAFNALKQGSLRLDQSVEVSDKAWRAKGLRMFVEPGKPVTVGELLFGLTVLSGRDASVALAEFVAGSEERFVELMNHEAKRLGMKDSLFRNATGNPDAQQYTTARDLALLASALIRDFPVEYARYFSLKSYTYNDVPQFNRNRLVFIDSTVDGLKASDGDTAGYGLIASAKRGSRRLVSVVLGVRRATARVSDSLKILNWGYQSFGAMRLFEKNEVVSRVRVWRGADNSVPVGFSQDFIVALPKGQDDRVEAELETQQPLVAPIAVGQIVGDARISVGGTFRGSFPVVALEAVPVAGFFGRMVDSVRLWFE